MADERSGKLKRMREEIENANKNDPIKDVDKLLKKQLEKEKEEKKNKEKVDRFIKEMNLEKEKNKKEEEIDFISPSEINKIKNNLNNAKNEEKSEIFYKNKNILQNIDIFGDNNPNQENFDNFNNNSNNNSNNIIHIYNKNELDLNGKYNSYLGKRRLCSPPVINNNKINLGNKNIKYSLTKQRLPSPMINSNNTEGQEFISNIKRSNTNYIKINNSFSLK